jgi:hypothetical protein
MDQYIIARGNRRFCAFCGSEIFEHAWRDAHGQTFCGAHCMQSFQAQWRMAMRDSAADWRTAPLTTEIPRDQWHCTTNHTAGLMSDEVEFVRCVPLQVDPSPVSVCFTCGYVLPNGALTDGQGNSFCGIDCFEQRFDPPIHLVLGNLQVAPSDPEYE